MNGDKDYTFDAPYVQDPLHKLLYRGRLFSFGLIVNSLADAAATKFIMNARSDDLTVFLGYGFSGNGHVHAFNVSSWAGGTALNVANNYTKYYGVNSITSQLLYNPTSVHVQASSTPIWEQFVPGGTKQGGSPLGGTGDAGEHFIVAPGQAVLIEFANHSGGGASIGFNGVLHETAIAQLDDPG